MRDLCRRSPRVRIYCFILLPLPTTLKFACTDTVRQVDVTLCGRATLPATLELHQCVRDSISLSFGNDGASTRDTHPSARTDPSCAYLGYYVLNSLVLGFPGKAHSQLGVPGNPYRLLFIHVNTQVPTKTSASTCLGCPVASNNCRPVVQYS